jgi:hypothetical protein
MLYSQRNNFVHIQGEEGLTKEYTEQAIEILGDES